MNSNTFHAETHLSHRSNWLRASVLGANDGLISTASLMMGMAAAQPEFQTLLLTGTAALAGGALSMAAGEYVSVSSQSDTEKADRVIEARELTRNPEAELRELAGIYRQRGLSPELAQRVAEELTAHNALDAHVRDEIGLSETTAAKPFQAALASAAAFAVGAALPLAVTLLSSADVRVPLLATGTVLGLGGLGYVSAKLGGAQPLPAVGRVVAWGVLALAVTGVIGKLMGVSV
ncbi:VIT1/CCC1 family predicted Fe2+/Mn2+ transporter [Neisseria sp. HSC-16F19]|nr:VIT family protein [Neisseria sp. HSC-16F19]MCP2041337.1 VIT1/CCC1 family predicted Fe2+/Mn2+ transporter [Neisseria sp. HSC-16F19]